MGIIQGFLYPGQFKGVSIYCLCSYWRKLLPQIVIMKPQIDLHWQCQQNSTLIFKALNKSAEEKSKLIITETMFIHGTFTFLKVIKLAEEHIELMQQERAHRLDTSSTGIKLPFQQCHHPGAIFQPTLQMPLFITVLTWHNRYIVIFAAILT